MDNDPNLRKGIGTHLDNYPTTPGLFPFERHLLDLRSCRLGRTSSLRPTVHTVFSIPSGIEDRRVVGYTSYPSGSLRWSRRRGNKIITAIPNLYLVSNQSSVCRSVPTLVQPEVKSKDRTTNTTNQNTQLN